MLFQNSHSHIITSSGVDVFSRQGVSTPYTASWFLREYFLEVIESLIQEGENKPSSEFRFVLSRLSDLFSTQQLSLNWEFEFQ